MTTLVRGNQFDIASSGQRPPIDIWAIATKGIWIQDTGEIPIPPESCWIPVTFPETFLTVQASESTVVLAAVEEGLTVRSDESSVVVNLGDRSFTVRRGC